MISLFRLWIIYKKDIIWRIRANSLHHPVENCSNVNFAITENILIRESGIFYKRQRSKQVS